MPNAIRNNTSGKKNHIRHVKPRLAKSIRLLQRSGLNIPHLICNHIIGKEHKIHHRITVGTFIMVIGVIISKSGGGVSILAVHYLLDTLGYLLHGIGTIPWIEFVTESVKKQNGAETTVQSELRKEMAALNNHQNGNTKQTSDSI